MPYTSTLTNQLKYDPSEFPTVILNDGSIKTIDQAQEWIAENRTTLERELSCTGALLFRGFPVSDAQSYDDFFSAFRYRNFTYKESLSNAVRINYTKKVFTANEAPKHVEIYLHNEMAQTPIFPERISLFCEQAADSGGETIICRSDVLYERLKEQEPELTDKLTAVGIKYTTHMPADNDPKSGQGRSWKSTLTVTTKEEAEERLQSLGYTWTWQEEDMLSTQTAALPAVREFSPGRKVFFNQLIAAYMGWKGVREDPSCALLFGDDSHIPKHFLETIVQISEDTAFNIPWQDGDVALVNNYLSMHGRRPYSGDRKRKVLVVLGLEAE